MHKILILQSTERNKLIYIQVNYKQKKRENKRKILQCAKELSASLQQIWQCRGKNKAMKKLLAHTHTYFCKRDERPD